MLENDRRTDRQTDRQTDIQTDRQQEPTATEPIVSSKLNLLVKLISKDSISQ